MHNYNYLQLHLRIKYLEHHHNGFIMHTLGTYDVINKRLVYTR